MVGARDWSLQRQGPKDQARHLERIRRAVRDRLPELIVEEAIIAGPPGARVRVPVRSLEEYTFRYDELRSPMVGDGGGGEAVGDLVRAGGVGAGTGEGEERLEAEVGEEELAAMLWQEMGLPRLRRRTGDALTTVGEAYRSRATEGPMALWDRRRTLYENLKRNARQEGVARLGAFRREDLRFRALASARLPATRAVVIAIRDVSGSMGEWKKQLSRSFFFWTLAFLRRAYPEVSLSFICHHTAAREVDEETFFRLGESGGTKVSSAYDLCRHLIRDRFPPTDWNVYVLHFSDGDNWGEADNRLAREILVRDVLPAVNLFGYAEVRETGRASTLMRLFEELDDERFVAVRMASRDDVLPALREFFRREGETRAAGP